MGPKIQDFNIFGVRLILTHLGRCSDKQLQMGEHLSKITRRVKG